MSAPFEVGRSSAGYLCEGDLVENNGRDVPCHRAARWKVTDTILKEDTWWCQSHFRRLYPGLWEQHREPPKKRRPQIARGSSHDR